MIYNIVNAVVYVVLAQLFCSSFLKRTKYNRITHFIFSIAWIVIVLGASYIFAELPAVRIVIAIVINIAFALVLFERGEVIKTISVAALFYVLVIVCETFVMAIHKYIDPDMRIERIMDSEMYIYMGSISQFIQILAVFMIRKIFRKAKHAEIGSKSWLIYIVFPVYSLSLITLLVYSFDGPISLFQTNVFTYIAISLLAINLFIYWFIKQESERAFEAQKTEMEIQHARGIVQLYDQITQERDILGKREHEFKNTITVLKGLMADEQYDKMKEILEVQNTELVNNTNVFETGNRLINTILNTKYAEAREKGIPFRFVINDLSSLKMEDRDCIVIISNVLNNAIEATEMCPDDKRFLSLKAIIEDDQFVFACRNSFVNDPAPNMQSNKRDVVVHGYGINNIKEAVTRNNGTCYFDKEEKEFVAVIIIPL